MGLLPGAPCSSEKEALPCDGRLLPVVFAPWMAAGRKEPGLVQGYRCRVQISLRAHSETSADTEKPGSWEAAATMACNFSTPAENNHPFKCSKNIWIWYLETRFSGRLGSAG